MIGHTIALPVFGAVPIDEALAWLSAPTEPWDVLVLEPRLEQGNGLAILDRCKQRCAWRACAIGPSTLQSDHI